MANTQTNKSRRPKYFDKKNRPTGNMSWFIAKRKRTRILTKIQKQSRRRNR